MNMFQYTKVITQTGLMKVAIVIKVITHDLMKNIASDFNYCWNFLPKIGRQCMRQSLMAMATISGTGLFVKAHRD